MSKPPLDIKNPTLAAAILRRVGALERSNLRLGRRATELEQQVVGLQQEVAKLRRRELSRAPDLEYSGEPLPILSSVFAIVDQPPKSSSRARAVGGQSEPQSQQALQPPSYGRHSLAWLLQGLRAVASGSRQQSTAPSLVPDDCQ